MAPGLSVIWWSLQREEKEFLCKYLAVFKKVFNIFREKKDRQNLITNCYDNHEYLYDTSQTRAQWGPSVWSWLMGSLHMYPFRLNGSYLVIFCHMYTTHSRLNVSKSSFRNILSNQMVYIWPWTHAIHICLAFFIVVLILNIRITYFQKKPNLWGWLNQMMNFHEAKPTVCDTSPAPILLIILRNIFDAWEKSCWLLKEILLRVKRPDVEKLDRWLLRDSGSHFVKDSPNVHFPDICKGLTRWCW